LPLYPKLTFSKRIAPLARRSGTASFELTISTGASSNLEHAPGSHEALLNRIGNLRHVGDLRRNLLYQAGEHHDTSAQWQFACDDEVSAVRQQYRDVDLSEHPNRGHERAYPPKDVLLLCADRIITRLEDLGTVRVRGRNP
jgi:hypothetical protein